MIEELSNEQEQKIEEHRKRYWQMAICTDPADRERAEAVARRLVEISEAKVDTVHWVQSPEDGAALYEQAGVPLGAPLRDLLRDSLCGSLYDLLRESLWYSLRASLWYSLRASLHDSLLHSLSDSLWDSLWDTGWLAFYSYIVDVLEIDCSNRSRELLSLYNELAASCFALWISPDSIVLCERPAEIEIEGNKLLGLTWRKEK